MMLHVALLNTVSALNSYHTFRTYSNLIVWLNYLGNSRLSVLRHTDLTIYQKKKLFQNLRLHPLCYSMNQPYT